MKPHKWADVIKAWADGAAVEHRFLGGTKWFGYREDDPPPSWNDSSLEFRVKPQKKSPGQVAFERVESANGAGPWAAVPEIYKKYWNVVGEAVINAYKAGEIE